MALAAILLVLAGIGPAMAGAAQTGQTAPTVSIETPKEGATVNGTVVVEGQAAASNGSIDRVEVRIDDGAWENASGTDAWTYSWETSGHGDGPHTISARAYAGGNTSQITHRNVTVQNEDPAPQVTIQDPDDGETVGGTVAIEGAASAPGAPIDRVEVRIDDGAWQAAEGHQAWTYSWDSTAVPDGTHAIQARAHADGATSRVANITVVVENQQEAPEITLAAPDAGATVEGTIEVRGQASDPDGDQLEVQVRIDDGAWSNATGTDPWTFAWDTTTVEDGSHVLQARVFDGDRHVHTELRGVEVDNGKDPASDGNTTGDAASAPRLELNVDAPANGAEVNGSLVVEGTVETDAASGQPVTVGARIDDGPWRTTEIQAGQPFSLELDLDGVSPGDHQLTVQATTGQATEEDQRTLTIAAAEQGATPSSAAVGLATFVVLLLLGIGGLWAWSRT